METQSKKRKGGSALSNLPQGGLQLNYNVFGYLQQLSSMVRLMCEREIQTAQKVWLLESWMQLLSWWHFPVISTGKDTFYPLNKQMLFKDTSYTPYWPSLYLAAYLIWFKILWYGKAFWDFPQDPPKPQNTVFMGSLQIFFTRSHKSLRKDSSQGIKGLFKKCLPTFHGEKKSSVHCGVTPLWLWFVANATKWHTVMTCQGQPFFAPRHWHRLLKDSPLSPSQHITVR